jgi:protein gp37
MGTKTGISWTDATWNPIRGCSKVSPGCKNCYAAGVAARFSGLSKAGKPLAFYGLAKRTPEGPAWTGAVRIIEERLEDPLRWRAPKRIFVNSVSDLFHENLDFGKIGRIFAVMNDARQHTYQVLTKRPARMLEFFASASGRIHALDDKGRVPSHIWLGVSVENQAAADERIPLLLQVPAAVRFLSCEPLLEGVNLERVDWNGSTGLCVLERAPTRIDWVIVGGESGSKARPFDLAWARSIRDQCAAAGVPYFFKQAGARPVCCGEPVILSSRSGADPAEWPPDLQVQQFPEVKP